MGFNLIKVQLVGGRTSKRNNGLDFLRLICYIMLSSYHFFNYYGSSYINPLTNGYQAYIIQNLGWGGGRMICNIFLFISAYYFCEKQDFKIQRVLKVWITVLLYSILFGILFFSHSDNQYFLSHLFPISTNVVWYATMYIGIIILSPLLNLLLNEKNRNITSKIVIVLFVLICIIPTFYPKFSRLGSLFSWFVLAYLIIGLLKVYNIKIRKVFAVILFFIGWIWCLSFYNFYYEIIKQPVVYDLFSNLGFYNNVYFADLATLPPFLSALGLFYLFKDFDFPHLHVFGSFISIASLDVYIIFSMEAPNKKLAWVELFKPGFIPSSVMHCYKYILFGLVFAIIIGNLREVLWKLFIGLNSTNRIIEKINSKLNFKTK